MKGVKYNLVMKLPNNETLIRNAIKMKEVVELCNEAFKTKYQMESLKITNQSIYNIIKRPRMCSKIYKDLLKVERLV
jgi:hypothetical protein